MISPCSSIGKIIFVNRIALFNSSNSSETARMYHLQYDMNKTVVEICMASTVLKTTQSNILGFKSFVKQSRLGPTYRPDGQFIVQKKDKVLSFIILVCFHFFISGNRELQTQ